jgi:excisionase family DNA binding protein
VSSIEAAVAAATKAGVDEALRPHLRKLCEPETLTYTVRQAAVVVGCGSRKIEHWIADGVLPKVPHIGNVLIPRIAVEALVLGQDPHAAARAAYQLALHSLPIVLEVAS